jgi:nucleotide-binding universal stress UspA family protein
MKLLIGYDGSECANDAINDLVYAGLSLEGQALVMTVADLWPGLLASSPPILSRAAIQRFATGERQRAEQLMAEAQATAERGAERFRGLFPKWQVTASSVADSPAAALVKEADRDEPDLLVVGTRGRSAFARAVLGNVALKVLQHAKCSVRIGRKSNVPAPGAGANPPRILIGVDGSVPSAAAVSAVADRAWPAGTQVRLVTALDLWVLLMAFKEGDVAEPDTASDHNLPLEDKRGYVQQMLQRVANELEQAGLIVTMLVKEGQPAHVIRKEAEVWGADCVYLGAQGLNRLERFLIGNVSASVAARAGCSVEVVRAAG